MELEATVGVMRSNSVPRAQNVRSSVFKALFFAGLASLLPTAVYGESVVISGEVEDATTTERSRPRFAIPQVEGPIVVDGELDEAAWRDALVLELDVETNPGDNIEVPEDQRTLCYLMHDERQLYVAFEAYDPEPEKVRARLNDRDNAFADDFVGIVLDPFNAGRRGFEFFVNPLGVQMDMIFDDVNYTEDTSWDAIWSSAGGVTSFGYRVEYAVPFSALRFPSASGVQVWGLDVLRLRPRDFRQRMAINPLGRDVNCYLCQFSEIEGFEGISSGRDLEIVPTITAGRTDTRPNFPEGPLEEGDEDTEAGLTVNWGLTPNFNLSGTLNPDFSQVEADVAQLDVNTQFTLFFPERRPFFLEDKELFDSPIDAVFTRNVSDPSWGLKLTGKQGKNALGVFVARDDRTTLLFPGSQGSSLGIFDLETTDAVVRYRRDLSEKYSLGMVATSRSGGDYSNHVVGFDGLLRFTPQKTLTFQVLGSSTEYPDDIAETFSQSTGSLDDYALRLAFNHDGRKWLGWATYQDFGEEFRADMGFVPQVDFRNFETGFRRLWWGDDGEWYSQMRWGLEYERTEDRDGTVLDDDVEMSFNIRGPSQIYFEVESNLRDRFFGGQSFDDQFSADFYFEMQPTASVYFNVFGKFGDEIDFTNVRQGEEVDLQASTRLELGQHLRAELSHQLLQLDVDGGQLFEANLSQLRLIYQFNRRTFLRAILQRTAVDRDLDLYLDPTGFEAEDEALFSQLLFSYKLNARTVLFLGTTDNQRGDAEIDLTRENRTFFLKVGYAWQL